ncbi:hypothetical protein F2Q68_00043575 [Brassica cretica]|uniref:Aminotransferase-like plant mobile domain-containing protein n=1 Tax=Brassica cretica TaxID=69181 RepID=A0A8S9LPA6_BRACR|nr:hypothetical protein F2Q68_00043575 [Brassica cretica]
MRGAVKKLEKARERIIADVNRDGCVSQLLWTSRFKDRDDDSLEHAAFLATWLSHLVFPHKTRSSISRKVFPIAVRLARGERVALASVWPCNSGLVKIFLVLVTHHSCNFTEKEAWDDYNKSLVGGKLYMPSRLASGSITARYRDWWSKSVSQFLGFEDSNETCDARNRVVDDDAFSPEVLPLSEVLQKMGEGFPEKLKRPRKLRIARRMESEIKKCKTGGCGESVVIDVPLSELFHNELARRPSEDLRDKRRKRAREDNDDVDENHMDSCDDIYESYDMTIAQLVKYRKKDMEEMLLDHLESGGEITMIQGFVKSLLLVMMKL